MTRHSTLFKSPKPEPHLQMCKERVISTNTCLTLHGKSVVGDKMAA